MEVFLPRIRFQRSTRVGPAWVTEALFLNYLFAKFDLNSRLRLVQAARGVREVLHFGTQWPTIPAGVIAELQEAMGNEDVVTITHDLQPGDAVEVKHGIFEGLKAVVTRAMPGPQRVVVLLDFLGRQTSVELDRNQLAVSTDLRGTVRS